MHMPQLKVELYFVLNIQFQVWMTFIYGGVALGMGVISEKGTICRQHVRDSADNLYVPVYLRVCLPVCFFVVTIQNPRCLTEFAAVLKM